MIENMFQRNGKVATIKPTKSTNVKRKKEAETTTSPNAATFLQQTRAGEGSPPKDGLAGRGACGGVQLFGAETKKGARFSLYIEDLASLNLAGLPLHQILSNPSGLGLFCFFALPKLAVCSASKQKIPSCFAGKDWVRSGPDLNRCRSFCRALPRLSATRPFFSV